ncbi:hypothetical protein H6B10_17240, partial [Gemmiger formicilis]
GAVNIYNAMLASPDAMFDINISRFVMNGKVIFAMFGMHHKKQRCHKQEGVLDGLGNAGKHSGNDRRDQQRFDL